MPWTRKRTSPSFRASSSKTRMNSSPIDLALLLGLGRRPRAGRGSAPARVDVDERDVEVAAEGLDHLLGLVLAQQAVVDEDARELVADRLVHEQRRDGGVDAAREAADHALRADLRADPLDLLLDHGGRRPRRAARRRRRRGSSSGPPARAACGRPRGGTGRRRAAAPASSKAAIGVDGDDGDDAAPVGRRDDGVAVAHPARSALPADPANSAAALGRERRSCRTRRRRCARRAPPSSSAISCMP